MTNSEKMLEVLDKDWRNKPNYNKMCRTHQAYIEVLKKHQKDVNVVWPVDKERVFGIDDLQKIKPDCGRFVDDFYFDSGKFVAELDDCDPYGYITLWISFSDFDKLNWQDLVTDYRLLVKDEDVITPHHFR